MHTGSKKMLTYIMMVLPTVLILQIWLSIQSPIAKIVNAHESIEKLSDVAKLKSSMEELGINTTVLHGIPQDLLKYQPGGEVDLSDVGNNHKYLAEAAEKYPETFYFFCNVDPTDEQRISKLEECLEMGGKGVKMYIGYSYAHLIPLDDPSLDPFYDYLEEEKLPLMLPVNTALYKIQLENVLVTHPNLNVICSHFCLASKDLQRLDNLMDVYPNLWVDTSFGHIDYFMDGLLTLTANHDEFKRLFIEHQDRILFATDNVITSYEDKDLEWILALTKDYIDLLSRSTTFESSTDNGTKYRGLALPYSVQRKVFWQNWESLVGSGQ